ncbi:uncharacterized protein OGAPODRAFT_99467 [Ogataea polymorpha]|uniref:uncharacterized protein n=1 Tax=Ogataea polymorpha TaxID=460523 RepID=UPI0007F4B4CA|nr:uncharacterized protein OGAPODRAFT_99467 [Ogataea polymorpha]OBA16600.1 hypothetical protein OGAPODRAFT_99467 [Ogataea polymorpha]
MISQELKDELDALEAIFPGCYDFISEQVYRFRIPKYEYISIRIRFPEKYPEEIPQILNVKCDKRGFDEKHVAQLLQEVLDSIFKPGVVCVFDFFTECDAILYSGEDEEQEEAQRPPKTLDPLANWSISEAISDRKSTFVGFARSVDSVEKAIEYLELLKQDRKVAKANHNMTAWRIKDPETGAQYQDCDDDGETAAGGRLLHLLSIMDVWNVMVVVSRWFGGVHIGPDRFKHINACARDAIVKGGFEIAGAKKKKKKKK